MSLHRPVLIVVGDKARARIFDTDTEDQSLQEIEDLVNADYGRHERDTGSDRPGRGVSAAGGRKTALGDDYSRRRILAARFAETVAERVLEHTRLQKYSHLYLVAGPEFNGLLNPCVASRSAQPPVTRVMKDLTRHSVEDIRKHLPQYLR
jgi:protein required for attachment to host cells